MSPFVTPVGASRLILPSGHQQSRSPLNTAPRSRSSIPKVIADYKILTGASFADGNKKVQNALLRFCIAILRNVLDLFVWAMMKEFLCNSWINLEGWTPILNCDRKNPLHEDLSICYVTLLNVIPMA